MLVLLLLFYSASIGHSFDIFPECERKRCDSTEIEALFQSLKRSIPSGEELKRFCPHGLKFISCGYEAVKECRGERLESFAASDNARVAEIAQGFMAFGDFLTDICNEDSQLNEDYVENVQCLNETLKGDILSKCARKAKEVYEITADSNLLLKDVNVRRCLTDSFAFACMVVDTKHKCGEGGMRVILRIYSGMTLFGGRLCDFFGKQILQYEFLDMLNLEEDVKPVYSSVFDIVKKK